MMRAAVKSLDAVLRRVNGIFCFCGDEDCLLRLQIARAPRLLRLDGRTVPAGEPVLAIHLWNEHVPPLPPEGPTLAWAVRSRRLFVKSLEAVAGQIRGDPRLAGVRAVGGSTALFAPGGRGGAVFLSGLGFTVMPYRGRWGRFGDFWENMYSWWLIWAYNPLSPRLRRRFWRFRRAEAWMAAEEFLEQFGGPR